MNEILIKLKKIITNKSLVSIAMSCFTYSYICLSGIIRTYDIFSWLIFIGLIILYLKADIFNQKFKKEIIILSILFSFLLLYGDIAYNIQSSREINIFEELISFKSIFNYIGIFNILYVLLINIYPFLFKFTIKKKKSYFKKSWIIFLICFVFIVLSWAPYFLTYFPGTLTPDSIGELNTVINNFVTISDHHPVIHMLFISIPYNIGFSLSGSITIGVALTTIFQMIIMASIFSYFIVFLHKRNINDFLLIIILLFYSIVPMHGYYSIVMWKDVIFAGTLLLLLMEIIKIIEKEFQNKMKFSELISFIIISIFCIFFRNNAVYMYFILAFISLIIFRKHIKIFALAFLIIFGIYFVVKGPVFKYFNVTKSASAEYIGMPLQQIGRMAYKGVKFTKDEYMLLNKLIPVDTMRKVYNPQVSDGIKFNSEYNGKVFDENKKEYFKLWFNLVLKNPDIAVEAYSISTLGYWYPGVEYWSVANDIYENDYDLSIESKAPNIIVKSINKLQSKSAPILNIEWSIGLCFWIILIFGILSVKKNGIIGIYPYVPIFGIWLTMMLASPVYAEFRYVYGAFTCLPLLIISPYFKFKKNF